MLKDQCAHASSQNLHVQHALQPSGDIIDHLLFDSDGLILHLLILILCLTLMCVILHIHCQVLRLYQQTWVSKLALLIMAVVQNRPINIPATSQVDFSLDYWFLTECKGVCWRYMQRLVWRMGQEVHLTPYPHFVWSLYFCTSFLYSVWVEICSVLYSGTVPLGWLKIA